MRITGPRLSSVLAECLAVLPEPASAEGNQPVTSDALSAIESGIASLADKSFLIHPVIAYRLARNEYQAVQEVLRYGSYGPTVGARLYTNASAAGRIAAQLATNLGDYSRAEANSLSAIRCAARSGSALILANAIDVLIHLHLVAGDPMDALTVTTAARSANTSPHLEVVLHIREARARARMGDIMASVRSIGLATETLTTRANFLDRTFANVNEAWLPASIGHVWLDAHHPRKALDHYAEHNKFRSRQGLPQIPAITYQNLLTVARAQLAANDLEASVDMARESIMLFSWPPPNSLKILRELFSGHATAGPVRDLLSEVSEKVQRGSPVH
ncbi:hypothetical protein AB0O91_00260 [Kitasatospora sp. NPDC089797]|uniref:hypothetical protein n=1 Tax=Kitasatospora sp. NPDC089797 TaxID=3155298 RepID=UPI003449BDF9